MKKKQVKLYFSDSDSDSYYYSDNSIEEITSLPSQNNSTPKNNQTNKKESKPNVSYCSDDEFPDGNNPFVLQYTSPFEISSSEEEYTEPTFHSKSSPQSPTTSSSVEQFYNQTSTTNTIPKKKLSNNTYVFTYQKKETLKGPRFHYQLTLNGTPLFHTKTKLRHPKGKARISSGNACHFSQKEFEGFLKISKKKNFFSLHQKTINGPELMSIELTPTKGPIPKNTKVILKDFSNPINNGIVANNIKDLTLVNLKPKKEGNGHWTLNFNGKYAIPSVKNCILVKDGAEDQLITIRRISSNSCEIDALDIFSPLCLFALGLTSFMSTF